MGYIITHPNKLVGFEVRSESVRIYEQHNPNDIWPEPPATHVFTNGNSSVELSKEFLEQVLAFFDNIQNRDLCDLNVPSPLETGE